MLEKYNLINAKPLHKTGRLWSDTTMIDLFFVIFVICGFFKITHKCKIPYNVSLVSLLKHGLYKAADKIVNRKNIAALDDALKALTNEADIATRLKTNLPQEMVVKDGSLMDDLAKSKSLAGADDARTVGTKSGGFVAVG
ncbi:hypothetical protein [Paenibacillus sp. IHBB 3054]|uniref:hypothetical protein n=1 Tax=Paenibacillus sp. IHBB 3054 TaxID=3425689 RepID=UPI003F6634B5